MSDVKFRHEYKYLATAVQLEEIKQRIAPVMQKDSHCSTDGPYKGGYNIRSLYFDDTDNTCYYENENGTDPREKFRIRIYNHSDGFIQLELKQKQSGKCRKLGCPLTREQAQELINGRIPETDGESHPLLLKLISQMRTRGLKPVVIVEYERIPFTYPIGNVRVTFDYNIRASGFCERFFDEDIPMRPILETGQHILEVKWDELLPDYINMLLQPDRLQWSSFSKFYLCRKFTKLF